MTNRIFTTLNLNFCIKISTALRVFQSNFIEIKTVKTGVKAGFLFLKYSDFKAIKLDLNPNYNLTNT